MTRPRARGSAGLAVLSLVCWVAGGAGCSTATLVRTDAPNFEGKIVDGDSRAVYVRGNGDVIYRVPRRTLVDIDHPGNVHALVGGLLTGLATAYLVAARFSTPGDDRDANLATGAVYGVVGLPLLAWGGYTHYRSLRNDEGHAQPPRDARELPEEVLQRLLTQARAAPPPARAAPAVTANTAPPNPVPPAPTPAAADQIPSLPPAGEP